MNKSDFEGHGLKNILVPTDFSQSSDTALHVAIDLARQQNARIYLLHVTRFRQQTDRMLRLENQIVKFAEAHAITIIPEVRVGNIYDETMKMVSENNIDLIVIPGHFPTGSLFDRFRNVTTRIKRKASCSVLVVGG